MNLAELIRSAKGDRSYEQLEAASNDRVPKRQRWHQLATTDLKNFPDPPTIIGIATALGVSQRAVVLAAAASLGIDADWFGQCMVRR